MSKMLRSGRRMDKFLEQTSRNVNEEINTKYNIIKRAAIEEVKPYVDDATSALSHWNEYHALRKLSAYLDSAAESQTNIVDLNEYSRLVRHVLMVNIVM